MSTRPEVDRVFTGTEEIATKMLTNFPLTYFKPSSSTVGSVVRTTHRAQGSATSVVFPPTWPCGPTHRK